MKKIDYSYMIRLKKLGFSLNAIARQCGCKWETVQRIILRCEEAWGGIGNIPGDATSEDIAFFDGILTIRKVAAQHEVHLSDLLLVSEVAVKAFGKHAAHIGPRVGLEAD